MLAHAVLRRFGDFLLLGLAISMGLGCKGGGEGRDLGVPEFHFGGVLGGTSEGIFAAAGGRLEYSGAVLTVPPGALAEDASLAIVEVSVDAASLDPDDGALGGQVLLSDSAFLIASDRAVELLEPLSLTLPFDPDKLPDGVAADALRVSGVVGGYIIPQGSPDEVDTNEGVIRISLGPDQLLAGVRSQSSPMPPMAAGAPFASILGGLSSGSIVLFGSVAAVGSVFLHPVLATVDDFRRFPVRESPHFNVRYRNEPGFADEALRVSLALELAYDLYVESLGFELPSLFDFDSRYTVYLDDFANHAWLNLVSGTDAEGFTLAGSDLVEGASYVNTTISSDQWTQTAAHEYFHALQYGAFGQITINSLDAFINKTNSWLYEGSAVALGARVIAGNGQVASRDTSLFTHLAQRESAFNKEAQLPAADVAQDFFFFLERLFASADFYLPMFRSLGTGVFADTEPSVTAIDFVLRERQGLPGGLKDAWRLFIRDFTIDNPSAYIADPVEAPPDAFRVLPKNGGTIAQAYDLAPLSYVIFEFKVPPFEKDTPREEQLADVTFTANALSGPVTDLAVTLYIDGGGGGGSGLPQEVPIVGLGFDAIAQLPDLRTDTTQNLRVVVANPSFANADRVRINLSGALTGDEPPAERRLVFAAARNVGGVGQVSVEIIDPAANERRFVAMDSDYEMHLRGVSTNGSILVVEEAVGGGQADRVRVYPNWGQGAPIDISSACGVRAGFGIDDAGASIADDGTVFMRASIDVGDEPPRVEGRIFRYFSNPPECLMLAVDLDGDAIADDLSVGDELVVSGDRNTVVFDAQIGVEGALWQVANTGGHASVITTNFYEHVTIDRAGTTVAYRTLDSGYAAQRLSAGNRPVLLETGRSVIFTTADGVAIDPDGSRVAVPVMDGFAFPIALVPTGGGAEQLLQTGMIFPVPARPAFSPDGRDVAFVAIGGASGGQTQDADIHLIEIDGGGITNLTRTAGIVEFDPFLR